MDDEDYERVSAHRWTVSSQRRADGSTRVYVKRSIRVPGRHQTTQYLHRFIMDAPVGMEVDHINGIRTDNRICNLRECTNTQNGQNILAASPLSSCGLRGVVLDKRRGTWRAEITVNGRCRFLGTFKDKHEAHVAYLKAKEKYHIPCGRTLGHVAEVANG